MGASKYIAFLRAINVGGHTVRMDRLRQLFEALGLARVETFIASGNVIFESPARSAAALEKKIEAHLEKELGYAVATFLRTPAELAAIAAHQPFASAETDASGASVYVSFFGERPAPEAARKLMALRNDVDDFRVNEREAYWLRRSRESSFVAPPIEKILGMPGTMRNVTTVRKLAGKYPAQDVSRAR
jgi:uncharacterized protein (DUF1697 family)